jgi:predicted transcriptional regulator
MGATAQSPVKLRPEAKEKLRLAAALTGQSQADVLETAVDEYLARNEAELARGLEQARAVLSGGQNAVVAYALGKSEAEIDRVAGKDVRNA